MVREARYRLERRSSVQLWTGDAIAIPAPDRTYDAVFDFGAIHHVQDWRRALNEIARVLKPGGRFFVEEVTRSFIVNPVIRRLFDHPEADRFDGAMFADELRRNGFNLLASGGLLGLLVWFVAERADAA
jgi:ubiquinone/menaquinone biosynthesis C-methylase UbiE